MKNLKRILAIVLTLVMVFGTMAGTAFADPETKATTGSIIITAQGNESLQGRSFEVYQIFDAAVHKDETTGNSSMIYTWPEGNEAIYKPFFENLFVAHPDVRVDLTGNYLTNLVGTLNGHFGENKEHSADVLANALYKHIKAANPKITPTAVGSSATGDKIVIDGLNLGYYFVFEKTELAQGQMRSAFMLTNVDPNGEIILKATTPYLTKEVARGSGEGIVFADGVSATIGDTLTYKIKALIPRTDVFNNYVYTIKDTVSSGLSPDLNTLNVYAGGEHLGTGVNNDKYDVTVNSEGNVLQVAFKSDWLKGKKNTEVELTYEAKLNSKGSINKYVSSGTGQELVIVPDQNIVELIYSSDPADESKTTSLYAEANVYTYAAYFKKLSPSGQPLPGVTFKAYRETNGVKEWAVMIEEQGTGPLQGKLKISRWTTDVNAATPLVSGQDGMVEVRGIGTGTYYLQETASQEGYEVPEKPFGFIITDTIENGVYKSIAGNKTADTTGMETDGVDIASGRVYFKIYNAGQGELPETGGMGTTMFIFGGIMLMAGAAAFLVLKKREAKN